MPPLRGAKRRRKAALEKKAAAAAMAAAAAGDAPADWWEAFCMRMSGASPSPVCLWLADCGARWWPAVRRASLLRFVADCVVVVPAAIGRSVSRRGGIAAGNLAGMSIVVRSGRD